VDRTEKAELVETLRSMFTESGLVVVTQQTGMTVHETFRLRSEIRKAGAGYKVTKNRITKLALQGTDYEGLSDYFTGPTAIAYSADPVSAAKVVVDFAKKNDKLTVVGAGLGTQVLDKAGVETLASLPSLDELRAKLLGVIAAPATKVAGVLQAPAGQLARVVNAYATKDEAA